MRILVTGGSGFIGTAFSRVAIAAGHEIAVLSRSSALRSDIRWLVGSIMQPPWPEIQSFAPEACLHAAWVATSGSNFESSKHSDWVRWSSEFLTRLSAINAHHITVLGTCLEYQITGGALTEDVTPVAPLSVYAQCKNQLHTILGNEKIWPQKTALAWARIFNAYGPGERPERFVSSLIMNIRAGKPALLKAPDSIRDFIYVDDVAKALLIIIERGFAGTINIGTGKGITVEAMARKVAALLGRPELIHLPPSRQSDSLHFVVADPARLRSLGWEPAVSLDTGLLQHAKSSGSLSD
jgi:dTDP-6-deoxy-L-talose 4-dehydrogenase (NAD+)